MNTASEVKQQLRVLHNPFSTGTQQPKIPDGRSNKSLGISMQQTVEVSNDLTVAPNGTMHIILFPGFNSCAFVANSKNSLLGTRNGFIPSFAGSNPLRWDNVVSPVATVNVSQMDNYAMWRNVSVGMQLKLLNSVETDDGWWEAIRWTPEIDNNEWILSTTDESNDRLNKGTLAPVTGASGLFSLNIANEPTYSTGLLRDLHRVQFELHTQKDYHEFIQMHDDYELQADDQAAYDAVNEVCTFNPGRQNVHDLINKFTDQNLDMVYIRLHCNTSVGSRFHMNNVLNQEVVFDPIERESRYQTRSHNIGTGATSIHLNARRNDGNAATLVTE